MKKIFIIILGCIPFILNAQTDTLTLAKAIAMALENNYGIIIQKKNVDIRKGNNTWGNTGALPTISASGSGSETWNFYDEDDAQTSSLSATVSLDWTVFRGFSARIQKSMLEKYEKQSETNLSLITENTIVNVTLAYYNCLLQQENLKSSETIMKLSKDRYDRESLKKELGNTTSYELLQSKNSWLEDNSSYLSAKSNYNNAIRQLNYLMAENIENTYTLSDSLVADTASFDKQVLIEKMLSNNNTLKNQYINLEMAKLSVRSAKSSYYPTVSVGANTGYNNSKTEYSTLTSMNSSSDRYSTGVSAGVSYVLFEGGQRKTAMQAAQIEEDISEVETNEMVSDLKNQLAQEYELYEVRKELLALAKENVSAAELNLEISTRKFETGTINSFNYRDIQQLYLNAVVNYHSAIYNVVESYNSLLQLTGGIIESLEGEEGIPAE